MRRWASSSHYQYDCVARLRLHAHQRRRRGLSQIIGAAAYGKPVLDRTLKYGDSLPFALKVGSLAFDSTRISAADVDFPVDVVMYRKGSFRMVERRYTKQDMQENADWWQSRLRDSVNQLSSAWYDGLFEAEKNSAAARNGAKARPAGVAKKRKARVAETRRRAPRRPGSADAA